MEYSIFFWSIEKVNFLELGGRRSDGCRGGGVDGK